MFRSAGRPDLPGSLSHSQGHRSVQFPQGPRRRPPPGRLGATTHSGRSCRREVDVDAQRRDRQRRPRHRGSHAGMHHLMRRRTVMLPERHLNRTLDSGRRPPSRRGDRSSTWTSGQPSTWSVSPSASAAPRRPSTRSAIRPTRLRPVEAAGSLNACRRPYQAIPPGVHVRWWRDDGFAPEEERLSVNRCWVNTTRGQPRLCFASNAISHPSSTTSS